MTTKTANNHHHPDHPHNFSNTDWYRVKYRFLKTAKHNPIKALKAWHYGLLDPYNDEFKRAIKRGCIQINDAITPDCWEIDLNEVEIVNMPLSLKSNRDEYDQFVDSEFKKAKEKSDSINGPKPGKLIIIGVADGFAAYVITKSGRKNVTIEWRGFCMDRYFAPVLGGGGTFPAQSIAPYCY